MPRCHRPGRRWQLFVPDLETRRLRQKKPTAQPRRFCRSDKAAISNITTAANGGLALLGGWYVYVTVPYVYVVPIVSVGRCSLRFNPALLSYAGPRECDGDTESCNSDKTIKDTMGDQGLAGMCDTAELWPTASRGQSWTAEGREAWASFALTCAWTGGGGETASPPCRWSAGQRYTHDPTGSHSPKAAEVAE